MIGQEKHDVVGGPSPENKGSHAMFDYKKNIFEV